jgi:hypothetical protein
MTRGVVVFLTLLKAFSVQSRRVRLVPFDEPNSVTAGEPGSLQLSKPARVVFPIAMEEMRMKKTLAILATVATVAATTVTAPAQARGLGPGLAFGLAAGAIAAGAAGAYGYYGPGYGYYGPRYYGPAYYGGPYAYYGGPYYRHRHWRHYY